MSVEPITRSAGISDTLNRIIEMSIDTYYNPYKAFEWPDTLPEQQWWMTPSLMTLAGTRFARELPEADLMRTSKWESIHFYSLNVHGIRELLLEVVGRVQTDEFAEETEFFHHFIGEENEHMWFFAQFCHRYGGKIYPNKGMSWQIDVASPDIQSLLVFSRILIFEEIVDYFNHRMGRDESLHPIIQKINAIHHQDESRHIAFGREVVRKLYEKVVAERPREEVKAAEDYIQRYLTASVQSLYNPAVYRDAGLPDPYGIRTEILASPERHAANQEIMKRTLSYFERLGVVPAGHQV